MRRIIIAVFGTGIFFAASAVAEIKTVYIAPMSHNDIGFTAPPRAVAEGAARRVAQALDFARKDPGYVWNVEVFWELDQWLAPEAQPGLAPRTGEDRASALHAPSAQDLREFLDLVRQGRFGIGASYMNPHTSLMSAWALDQLFRVPAEWAMSHGLKLDWAAINDVPGHPGDLPKFAAANGVRHLLLGVNQGFSKPLPPEVCNTPFWWESPDGSRVLTWIAKGAYTEAWNECGIDPGTARFFNPKEFTQKEPLEIIRHGMRKLQEDFRQRAYPYDAAVVMHAFDNWDAGAAARLPEAVRLWNESGGEPKLVIATPGHFFRHIETRYGAQLPIRRGGFGGQWEMIRAGAPTAMARAREREAQLLRAGRTPAVEDIRRLLVYWEHTWALNTPWPGHLTRAEAVEHNHQQFEMVADWPLPQAPSIPPLNNQHSTPDAQHMTKADAVLRPNALYVTGGLHMDGSAFTTWKGLKPLPGEVSVASVAERMPSGGIRCRHRIDRRKLSDPAHVVWAWKLSEAEAGEPVVVQTASGTMRWPDDGLCGYAPSHWVAPWGFTIGSTRFTTSGPFVFARLADRPNWLLCYVLSNARSATFKGGQKGPMAFEEVYPGEEPECEFIIDVVAGDGPSAP